MVLRTGGPAAHLRIRNSRVPSRRLLVFIFLWPPVHLMAVREISLVLLRVVLWIGA